MKPDIHPKSELTKFHCNCGATFEIYSSLGGSQSLDICSHCHPFFKGGGSRLSDSAGRIDKFKRRYNRA